MKIKMKSVSYFFLFLYLIAISAYQLGTGFDALFVRIIFVLFVFSTIILTKNIKFVDVLKWALIFWIYYYLSMLWASNIEDTLYYFNQSIQIICLAICLPKLIEDTSDIKKILNMLIVSILYSSILLIARTPASSWGTERIGEAIGLYSNAFGTRLAIASILSLHMLTKEMKKDNKSKILILFYLFCMILFSILNFFTGSRKSLFVCIAGIISYELLSTKGIKFFVKTIVIGFLIVLITYILYNIPEVYAVIGRRINAFIQTVFTENSTIKDGSLKERLYYISVAKYLFINNPIIGVGGNNFVTYLRDIGYSHVAYSHNNFYEMLATLGFVGFILYYSIWINTLFNLMKKYKNDNDLLTLLFLIIIIVFILSDFFTVSYITDFNQVILIIINIYIFINKSYQIKGGKNDKNYKIFK